jgi:hypothetical protein
MLWLHPGGFWRRSTRTTAPAAVEYLAEQDYLHAGEHIARLLPLASREKSARSCAARGMEVVGPPLDIG